MEEALHTAPYIYMPAASDDTFERSPAAHRRSFPTGGCVCKANGRVFSLPRFTADISGGFLIASTRWRKANMFQLPLAGISAAVIRPPGGKYLNCWSSLSCCVRAEAAVAIPGDTSNLVRERTHSFAWPDASAELQGAPREELLNGWFEHAGP